MNKELHAQEIKAGHRRPIDSHTSRSPESTMHTETSSRTVARSTTKAAKRATARGRAKSWRQVLRRADVLATPGISLVKTRVCPMFEYDEGPGANALRSGYADSIGTNKLRIDLYRSEGEGRTCWIKVAYYEGGRLDGGQYETMEPFHTRAEALARWPWEPCQHYTGELAIPAILEGR